MSIQHLFNKSFISIPYANNNKKIFIKNTEQSRGEFVMPTGHFDMLQGYFDFDR